MTKLDEGLATEAPGTFQIIARHGLGRDTPVALRRGAVAIEIIRVVAGERGWTVEDLVVFEEGEPEPLPPDHPVSHGHRHHVHRRGSVEVLVHYQGRTERRAFPRQAALEAVLGWSIKAFAIDAAMAAEFELARVGHKEELPASEHVGHVADGHPRVELNLVRGDIANGAGP